MKINKYEYDSAENDLLWEAEKQTHFKKMTEQHYHRNKVRNRAVDHELKSAPATVNYTDPIVEAVDVAMQRALDQTPALQAILSSVTSSAAAPSLPSAPRRYNAHVASNSRLNISPKMIASSLASNSSHPSNVADPFVSPPISRSQLAEQVQRWLDEDGDQSCPPFATRFQNSNGVSNRRRSQTQIIGTRPSETSTTTATIGDITCQEQELERELRQQRRTRQLQQAENDKKQVIFKKMDVSDVAAANHTLSSLNSHFLKIEQHRRELEKVEDTARAVVRKEREEKLKKERESMHEKIKLQLQQNNAEYEEQLRERWQQQEQHQISREAQQQGTFRSSPLVSTLARYTPLFDVDV